MTTKLGVSIAALCLGSLGLLLLFAPSETIGVLAPLAGTDGLVQLLGAALLGLP